MPGIAGVELLESRFLCAADGVPPTLQMVRVVGPPSQATAVALTFSEPLDPVRAANPEAYRVFGAMLGDAGIKERSRKALASAKYDDATRTVTLVPEHTPFNSARGLRLLRVDAGSVASASGEPLDGDGDGVGGDSAEWLFRNEGRRRTIIYSDANRSRVKLRLSGPGRLRLTQHVQGTRLRVTGNTTFTLGFHAFRWGEGLQLWVEGATLQSVLTGTVTTGRHGLDAITSIFEIVNPGGARLDLLADPAFVVTQ